MSSEHEKTTTLAHLTTLKRQFEAAASQYHRLCHLLLEAPADQPGNFLDPFPPVEGCRRPEEAIATSFPSTDIVFRVKDCGHQDITTGKVLGLRRSQFHAYYLSGREKSVETFRHYQVGRAHFERLAERAGELLLSIPALVLNIY